MKFDAWLLAVVSEGTGQEPWAEIHPTRAQALASVVDCFWGYIEGRRRDPRLTDEKFVVAELADQATFTIEPAVIDTDELTESE